MTRAEILEKIVEDIQDNISLAQNPILEEHTLVGDLGIDSLELIDLLMSVEEIFAFDIDDDEAYAWTSVGNVVDTVERFFAGA